MPKVYTVQTDNAFSALYDASDNEEVILSSVPAHLQEQPESTQVPRPRREKEERPQADKRGPRPVRREDGDRRPPRTEQGEGDDAQVEGRSHIRNRERRVGPKPEAQTDKASGTGRGKELKKDGGGAHGWGNQNEDHGGDQGGWETEAAPAQEGEEGAPEEGAAPPKETAPPVVSYAEYQKQENREVAALSEKPAVKSQRAVEEGCQVYTKAHVQEVKTAAKDGKDASKSGKAMHLTELAAQSGVQVRYSGDDKRRNNPRGGQDRNTQEREGARDRSNGETGEAQPKNTPKPELKLDDQKAFPTLAH